MTQKTAIIIGAGPAGLTAAYELLDKTTIKPIIFEMTGNIGGISKTIVHHGNRIDIGGHRFFSKSQQVTDFWLKILPLQAFPAKDYAKTNREVALSKDRNGPDPEKTDCVMLIRSRLSRIFFLNKLFNYPISLNFSTISKLGFFRTVKAGLSYLYSCIFQVKPEKNLEDFLINRFGKHLYLTFFKDYSEKIWGVTCAEIPADWGRQRIKGLSIWKAIVQAAKNSVKKDNTVHQKKIESSLITQFLYPKFGPGQMWENLSDIIIKKGGQIHFLQKITTLQFTGNKITEVTAINQKTGEKNFYKADYVFSTMPVKDLIADIQNQVPKEVRQAADGLLYRNFIIVGLLLQKLILENETNISTINNIVPDNWIYMQRKNVSFARLQIFNNWSPYMVKSNDFIWVGVEYICDDSNSLWTKTDTQITSFAIEELLKVQFVEKNEDVLDSVVVREPKAYPAYFGTYHDFNKIQNYLELIENLFLIGRNGMHRYNNQDHSMLTAMIAVENIKNSTISKANIWSVNTNKDYHEKK